jgi:hypothetical protein
MSALPAFVESLEDRRLLSVSAAAIAGPRTTGTVWTYQVDSPTAGRSTQSRKVIGPANVGSVKTIEVDVTAKVAGVTGVTKDYSTLDSAGFRTHKMTGKNTGGGFSSTSVTVPTPPSTALPASLRGGTTYTYHWSEKTTITTTSPVHFTTTSVSAVTYTVKLLSETTKKLTVPGGTFNVYTLNTVYTSKVNNQTSATRTTLYVAAGLGQVKAVVKDQSGATTNIVLTKFTKMAAPKVAASGADESAFSVPDARDQSALASVTSTGVWERINN